MRSSETAFPSRLEDEGVGTESFLATFLLETVSQAVSIFPRKFELILTAITVKMTFNLQYVSDIHLEAHDKRDTGSISPEMFVKPSAPYLALCGDISIPDLKSYDAFLEWCSSRWEKIFLVAGNHEYYNFRCKEKTDMAAKKKKLEEIVAKYPNIHFLECSSYYLEEYNLRILGCTLWSDTSIGDRIKILTYMNDGRSIRYQGEYPLLPEMMTELHLDQYEWLYEEINKAEERKEQVVVLTHYMPSFQLVAEKYQDNPLNMCFASDCEELMRPPVKAWICGHSHTGVKKEINGVLCLMNPFGYPGERVDSRSREAVLTLGV
jgi:predicted phosphodiesterase